MCYKETRQWTCNCSPAVYYNTCTENPFRSVELCHVFQKIQSSSGVPCSDCNVFPTPPSSPSAKIRQLKDVFESRAVTASAPAPVHDCPRGTRHRRESVGKLDEKCTECRIWGLPCDLKEPHCSNCLKNGTVCETAREWLGRVSGKSPTKSRSSSISAPVAPIPAELEAPLLQTTNLQAASSELQQVMDGTLPAPTVEDYSVHHKATDESLADLKKNIRGLRAALNLLESEKDEATLEPEVERKPEPVNGAQDYANLPEYMDFYNDKRKDRLSWQEQVDFNQVDLDASPFEASPSPFIKQDESSPLPFLSDDSNMESVSIESSLPGDMAALQAPLNNDPEFRKSLNNLNITSRKVRTAAQQAYRKLKTVARSKKASFAFRRFVASLGSLDNILRIGSQTFEMLLDQQTPHSLIEIYCFLHFAYAMSQGDTDLIPSSSEGEYQKGLLVFRSCLPSTPEYDGIHSQRDIFDEIAHHMADELECALRWAKKQNLTPTSFQGLSLEDVLRLHSEQRDSCQDVDNVGNSSIMRGSNATQVTLFGSAPGYHCNAVANWKDVQSLRVFNGVSRFLIGLNRYGSPFKLFSGEFCKSIASGIYKHPIYSKSFRHESRLFDADHMRDNIHTGVICKFDRKLIAQDSVAKVLETSLEMFDLGSLITLEDYVEYARGLLMAVLLPFYLVKLVEDEIIARSQELIKQLPAHLMGRVQWPEGFTAPARPAVEILETGYEVAVSTQPEPSMPTLMEAYYPSVSSTELTPSHCSSVEVMDYELYSSTPESTHSTLHSHCESTSTPHTSSCSEAGDSPKSNPSPPSTPSLVCPTCSKTFTNKSNLARHERTKHTPGAAGSKKQLRCPIPGCKTMLGSARAKENMRTHLKKKHGIERPGMEEVRWRVDVMMGCV